MKNIYLSTTDPNAHLLAKKWGVGIELAEFCTAWNMDRDFGLVDPQVREKLGYSDRFVLHAPFNELFPCAIDLQARELAARRYRQAMDLAVGYGIKKLVIHGGFQPFMYYPVWYVEQSIVFWKEFVETVPEDMVLCLENVLEPEPYLLKDIVAGVNDPRLRLCLDVGHVNAYSEIPVETWVEDWAPWLSHYHIHNNDGSADTHQPLFAGSMDFKGLLAQIRDLTPDATLTMELYESESSLTWMQEEKL
jgi:sugar phosphate isomerase/epimerase